MHKATHHKRSSRVGHWLAADRGVLNAWLAKTRHAAEKKMTPVHPVILELQETIESDPVLLMYFTQMFEEQPGFAPPADSGDIKLRDYHQLLQVLDHVLTTAPEFTTAGMVGCPINAVLDFPMITPAGLAAFASAKLNHALKKMLTAWAQFLDSPASLYVLNETPAGWLSPAALEAIHVDEYVHDAKAIHRPFLAYPGLHDGASLPDVPLNSIFVDGIMLFCKWMSGHADALAQSATDPSWQIRANRQPSDDCSLAGNPSDKSEEMCVFP